MSPDFLDRLAAQADRIPDASALGTVGKRALTYRELVDTIGRVAHNLGQAEFRPGDRMLFSIRPSVSSVTLIFGAIAAGGTIVFVDPGVGPELFAKRIGLVEPDWAATESLLYTVSGPLAAFGRRRGLALPRFGALDVRHIHSGVWMPGTPFGSTPLRRISGDASRTDLAPADPDAAALIVFTSGTTDEPKAVVHTRASLSAGLAAMGGRTSLAPGAFLHTEQLMMGLPALMAGARWAMPRYPRFGTHIDPVRFTRNLRSATHAFYTPADLAFALDALESGAITPPPHLRQVALGGAPVTTALLRRARKSLPDTEFLAIYGMTEILPVAVATDTAKLAHDGDLLGTPVRGVVARVADDGELVLAGPNLCRGYLGAEPLTEIASGDLARWDDGQLVLTGRKKDMMIRGKTNIYPGLYEPVIAAIDGVREAIMVGIPDEIGDERIILAVVADPDAGDIAARLRTSLPHLIDTTALPDEIVVLDHIPVTGRTSKPDRTALRELLAQRRRAS
ncbi:class I adenylate-forming enzyme family protein [Nocardia mangyaensis]|uniref:class I adenylate-forming enzyme family protein n=1 Tax=Nocardia mangyaensis TaxID=2213200 RepID=UPI00267466DC|nr:class I adenylate-forming enzyme family protein [Nocardia mangyaensis]MDO3645486.1 class I adenylate-forming enzyme family protein [Nocardia mangyaensis]